VVCRGCGTVDELPTEAAADPLAKAGRLTAFQLDTLVITGLCPNCDSSAA
jgi:Fe2+ or Zn2+ uptake regulation protein